MLSSDEPSRVVRIWQMMFGVMAFTTVALVRTRSIDQREISQLWRRVTMLEASLVYSGQASSRGTFWGSENSTGKYCEKMELCDIYTDHATCLCNGYKVSFDKSGVVSKVGGDHRDLQTQQTITFSAQSKECHAAHANIWWYTSSRTSTLFSVLGSPSTAVSAEKHKKNHAKLTLRVSSCCTIFCSAQSVNFEVSGASPTDTYKTYMAPHFYLPSNYLYEVKQYVGRSGKLVSFYGFEDCKTTFPILGDGYIKCTLNKFFLLTTPELVYKYL
jgi:hypothetical protein